MPAPVSPSRCPSHSSISWSRIPSLSFMSCTTWGTRKSWYWQQLRVSSRKKLQGIMLATIGRWESKSEITSALPLTESLSMPTAPASNFSLWSRVRWTRTQSSRLRWPLSKVSRRSMSNRPRTSPQACRSIPQRPNATLPSIKVRRRPSQPGYWIMRRVTRPGPASMPRPMLTR